MCYQVVKSWDFFILCLSRRQARQSSNEYFVTKVSKVFDQIVNGVNSHLSPFALRQPNEPTKLYHSLYWAQGLASGRSVY